MMTTMSLSLEEVGRYGRKQCFSRKILENEVFLFIKHLDIIKKYERSV